MAFSQLYLEATVQSSVETVVEQSISGCSKLKVGTRLFWEKKRWVDLPRTPKCVNFLGKNVRSFSEQIRCLQAVWEDGHLQLQSNSGFSLLFSCALAKRNKMHPTFFCSFSITITVTQRILRAQQQQQQQKRSFQNAYVYKLATSATSTQCITRQRTKLGTCLTHTTF